MTRSAPRKRTPEPTAPISIRLPEGIRLRVDVAAARSGQTITALVQDMLAEHFPPVSPLDAPLGDLAGVTYDPDAYAAHRLTVMASIRTAMADLATALDQEEARARKDLGKAMIRAAARINPARAPILDPSEE